MTVRSPTGLLLGMLIVSVGGAELAGATSAIAPRSDGETMVRFESPLGAIAYDAGHGLRFAESGVIVGGYTTVELESVEGEFGNLELDAVHLLGFSSPHPRLNLVAEIEIGGLARWTDLRRSRVESRAAAVVERSFGELRVSEPVALRFGKFRTPFGLWNRAPAEPLVWTTSRPSITDGPFDEQVTGLSLHGGWFPDSGRVSYEIYGQLRPGFEVDADDDPAGQILGLRLELEALEGWSVGASLFSSARERQWRSLGGLDAAWRTSDVELSSEAILGQSKTERSSTGNLLLGVYLQSALRVVADLWGVLRYEHFDEGLQSRSSHSLSFGVAWRLLSPLLMKADYLFSLAGPRETSAGFRASLSVLF